MKGFVPTPSKTVDFMVDCLFRARGPQPNDRLLDPGCGGGEFIDGVIRWCTRYSVTLPTITGVELDPRHIPSLRIKYASRPNIRIIEADFLTAPIDPYDFIIGNPPYVSITGLTELEKATYRSRFLTARGRFDLYLLFFEQAMRSMAPKGRLVFITPEKFLYVETAQPLRDMLSAHHIEEIRLIGEDTFPGLTTYPTITTINKTAPGTTRVVARAGSESAVSLLRPGIHWLPLLGGGRSDGHGTTLADVSLRISCGVATGADRVFVRPETDIDAALLPYARPTIAGRALNPRESRIPTGSAMLLPYAADGTLLPLTKLGEFGRYLSQEPVRTQLLRRTCVRRKPWYAFHETPMLTDMIRPKILCKDIGQEPWFWVDRTGEFVPRHSVYYIVPQNPSAIGPLVDYLRSPAAHQWLRQNCQRAAKGYLRLQSRVLQRLPLPPSVVEACAGEAVPEIPATYLQQNLALAR
jgi:hypothetical protein